MRCAIGTPLPVPVWLAVPLLFIAAVLGLTGLGGLLLGSTWAVPLSSGVFGAAAATAGVLAGAVPWRTAGQRAALALPYPAVWFAAGLFVGHVAVPAAWAVGVGVPAAAAIAAGGARLRGTRTPPPPPVPVPAPTPPGAPVPAAETAESPHAWRARGLGRVEFD
ncbi:hypothetical protein V5P93_006190 [Actinokineospora auranticolor]|uniref:Uncharacterized protein n=1 Tax=Actinokineospora auranticolor TaxID=155976 RepID=A0A2S6GHU3_9PSEU|nr:hypothetical protein [Actinokineospora auranticolor]PPK64787.1 hypothetical protein CLV40_11725 [Actinokineospora auranticolor]